MQTGEQRALKKCYKLLAENLDLQGYPQILASLYEENILSQEGLLKVKRLATPCQQNTELYLRLKRCDAAKQPFTKFCCVLTYHGHQFISDKLQASLRTMATQQIHQEKEKCVYCVLMENLYPDEVAMSLYEDSGLSSATLEDVTVTEGVTRRDAVRRILKKLVTYQKEKGPGREYIHTLANALPENRRHLLPYLESASIEDFKGCKCTKDQPEAAKSQGHLKVKSTRTPRSDDLLDISDLLPSTIQDGGRNNKRQALDQGTNTGMRKKVKRHGHIVRGQGEDEVGETGYCDRNSRSSHEDGQYQSDAFQDTRGETNQSHGHLRLGESQCHSEGREVVRYVAPPGRVQVGPDKQHRTIVAACGEMDVLINNGFWDQFRKYNERLLLRYPDDVDVKLNVLHHTVFTHCVQNIVSMETHDLLRQSKELIPRSTCPQYFEIDYLGMLSKVFRKDKQFGFAECCVNCIYQKSKLLFPEKIVTLAKHRDAEYLIHQFRNKFATNSVPENIFRQIEEGFLSCIEQSTRVREDFRKSDLTMKYADDCYVSGRRCHIHLALLYLRCCITGEGTTEAFRVSPADIARAERSLGKVVEEWEGISSRTESKYLLAMSDLNLRKKDYQMALAHARDALRICERKNHMYMAGWAERRISYLETRLRATNPVRMEEESSGCEAGSSSGVDSLQS